MKKLSLSEAALRLLVLFALLTPVSAGTITEITLSVSSSTDETSASTTSSPEASKEFSSAPPGRSDSSKNMPSGTRAYTFNGDSKTYAFGTTRDFLNAVSLMSNSVVSLSSVNFGRIPFQQLLIVSPKGTEASSMPTAQLPEPASLILLGTGLAALGFGMKKRKSK